MSSPKDPSVFSSAMSAAAALQLNSVSLSSAAPHLLPQLAAAGCHAPIFISAAQPQLKDNPESKAVAENHGALVADLVTQAAADAGHPEIQARSVVWLDKGAGNYRIGIAAGTAAADAPPLYAQDFPAQAISRALKDLREEMLGTPEGPSRHWEANPIEETSEGLTMAHEWVQDTDRKRQLYPMVKALVKLQGLRHVEVGEAPDERLLVQKDDLEAVIGREQGRGDIPLA